MEKELDWISALVVEPTESDEVLNIVGHEDERWKYAVEQLRVLDGGSRSQASAVIRKASRASEYLRGTTNQKPFTPAAIKPKRKGVDEAFGRSRLEDLRDGRPDRLTEFPQFLAGLKEVDIYNLGKQDYQLQGQYNLSADAIHEMEIKRSRAAAAAGENYIVGDNSRSGVALSLKQEGFRLDSVFQRGDESLFGLEDEDDFDDETDDDESESPAHDQDKNGSVEDQDIDATIMQLDSLLKEESDASRSRQGRSKFSEAWAAEDTSDGSNFSTLVPDPVKVYPFDLDPFQKKAIMHIEKGENVFVAAHTSAGKTVVAEYAIALSERNRTRVIYTSPIKSLSNQKFRDFSDTFGDVGIVTGDVSHKQEAACLVMTTEILRSMLYKGADLIRDIEWVIFDEVHYVNDLERGVVWEEVIIMLPEHVRIVMLSATVPNAIEFAEWVGSSRQSKVYVISTLKRPVPLEHSLFVKNGTTLVLDSSKRWLSKNFNDAVKADAAGQSNLRGRPRHAWGALVKYLEKQNQCPAVIFCFSKNKCEEAAYNLGKTDLSEGSAQKAQVHMLFEKALAQLNNPDRELPQILRVRDMLKRGIGVHHAGLLPIVKEVVEILFQKGTVKILFATETFAMGVNMPARTVVFTALRKHDGQSFRFLQAGEYTQMAGRAGRRGLDKIGNVLLYFASGSIPSEMEVKNILCGRANELVSQFRLTYNMVLNLLRIEDLRIEDMIRRSFAEAPAKRETKKIKRMIERGTQVLDQLRSNISFLSRFEDYFETVEELRTINTSLSETIFSASSASSVFFGKVIVLERSDRGMALGVVFKVVRTSPQGLSGETKTIVRSLNLLQSPGSSKFFFPGEILQKEKALGRNVQRLGQIFYEIRDVQPREILSILNVSLKLDREKLVPLRGSPDAYAIASALEQMRKVAEDSDELNLLNTVDPRKELKMMDVEVYKDWERSSNLLANLFTHPMVDSPQLGEAMDSLYRMRQLEFRLERLRWASSDESLQLRNDSLKRIDVLKRLNYVSEDNVVQLKGRSACEVNTCDSLILTELIFENVLKELEPDACAALLTALVCQDKMEEEVIPQELLAAQQATDKIVAALAMVQDECGLPISALEYARYNVRWSLSNLVLHWARGEDFNQILEYAIDIPEGSIVRCVVRLSELLRETRNAAGVIGDISLFHKMEEAMTLVKRDIIFAASLYLS